MARGRRIRESGGPGGGPLFLLLWGALFGGIPVVIIATDVAAGGQPPPLIYLFPLIGLGAVAYSLWTWVRAGFAVDDLGISGAHASESDTVPWDRVESLRWQQVTEPYELNDRPVVSTVLVAALSDGDVHRITTRDASFDERRALFERLLSAQRQGLVPVALDHVDPARGHIHGSAHSHAHGEAPTATAPLEPTPAPHADGPLEAEHRSSVDWDTDDAGSASDDEPPPVWPT